jgi:hypothetical protein
MFAFRTAQYTKRHMLVYISASRLSMSLRVPVLVSADETVSCVAATDGKAAA